MVINLYDEKILEINLKRENGEEIKELSEFEKLSIGLF